MLVAEHLDLDVARLLDELLDEHAVVAEAVEALALHAVEALAHVLLVPREAHALAAAAGRGLHHHRKPMSLAIFTASSVVAMSSR